MLVNLALVKKKNNISNVGDAEAIVTFRNGCRDEFLTRDLGRTTIETMGDLMAIANEHASGEEAWIAK